MKVLLINPPFHRFFGSEQDYIPLGLTYLANTVEDCYVYNAEINTHLKYVGYKDRSNGQQIYIDGICSANAIWDEVERKIREYNPIIVGIYVPSVKLKSALRVAEITKKINPNIKVVMGGPHPTIRPEEVLDNKNVDAVLKGEGESIFPTLVSDLSNGANQYIYEQSELIKNINTIKFPARDKLLDHYSPNGYGHIISARGCPYGCTYCGSVCIWHRTIRFRNLDNIMEEIKEVRDKYGTTDFTFWDETFTVNKKRINEFCDKIKPLNVNWRCDTRIDVIDKKLLLKMIDSGLHHISIGVESGNQETLDFIKKGITVEQIKKAAKILNETGVYWKAYLMIGFPNETEQHILDTLNIIYEIKPKRACLSIFTPYPGTELFDYCIANNIITNDICWERYSHQSKLNYFTPKIERKRFQELVELVSTKLDEYNGNEEGYKKWLN